MKNEEMKKVRDNLIKNLKASKVLAPFMKGKGKNIWAHEDSHCLVGVYSDCHIEVAIDCENEVVSYGFMDRDSKSPAKLNAMLKASDLEPIKVEGTWALLNEVKFEGTVKAADMVVEVVRIAVALKSAEAKATGKPAPKKAAPKKAAVKPAVKKVAPKKAAVKPVAKK